MNEIFQALSNTVHTKNWYGALIIALTIPDICSKLENPNQDTNIRYPKWFDKFSSGKYDGYLSGKDCYLLRCAYLHEGTSSLENKEKRELIDRVSLSPEGSHCLLFDNIHVGSPDDGKTILHISVKNFCEDMIEFGNNWMITVQTNSVIQERIGGMMQIKNNTTLFNGAINIQ